MLIIYNFLRVSIKKVIIIVLVLEYSLSSFRIYNRNINLLINFNIITLNGLKINHINE